MLRFLGRIARMTVAFVLAAGLLVGLVPVASAAEGTCWVRNVSQDTTGRSLIRMVERAVDGHRLRVRGTCKGEVVIDIDLRIRGMGSRPTLTGNDRTRVLRVKADATVSLRDLVVEHGQSGPFAGGIWNSGSLTLTRVVVRANVAVEQSQHGGAWAGGIFNKGTLTLLDSVVRDNRALHGGGGISNGGDATLVGAIVARNEAPRGYGGGIDHYEGALNVVDSIVRRNAARLGGAMALEEGASSNVIDSVMTSNTAKTRGGGIYNHSAGVIALSGTRISANTAGIEGGGIWNFGHAYRDGPGVITLDITSSVTGNVPDDCVGTTAC